MQGGYSLKIRQNEGSKRNGWEACDRSQDGDECKLPQENNLPEIQAEGGFQKVTNSQNY